MNITLNNETITLDKDAVFRDPKAEAIAWLRERKEKTMKKPPIEEMTAVQCYAELDRLRLHRQIHGRGRSPDACQARYYCSEMRKAVKKRLRQLKAPLTRPGDRGVYGPGAAAWQRAGGAP